MTRRLDIYPRWLARLRPACLLLPLVLASCAKEQIQAPPSAYGVILISVDTLRADRLNCYGYQARKVSPHIDALAADGILFENHVTTSPWTTPAHLSMLTSLYPSAHGVTQTLSELQQGLWQGAKFNRLPAARTTLAEVLQDSGYATAAFTGGATVDPRIGFGQGFERYDTSMFKLGRANMQAMYDWVRQQHHSSFFLFWHNFEVHAPYVQTCFLNEVLPAETAASLSDELGAIARTLVAQVPGPDQRHSIHSRIYELLREKEAYTLQVCEALYLGGIRSLDDWLGDFMQLLVELDLYDRCLIILTSDHGEEFADHSPSKIYSKHGHTLYEELLKVPLIIKLPHQQYAGSRVKSVVRMIDIMPTVLDVLEIEAVGGQMQGTSLRPLWERQPGRQEDRLAVSEALCLDREKKSVRAGRYKYIISMGPGTLQEHGRGYIPEQIIADELYDLQHDPAEKVNLLRPPPNAELARLAEPLEQHLREHVRVSGPAAEQVQLDAETIESLKALGYIR